MRIDRLKIKNFRNLADVDVRLQPGMVIVGENRVGKSNLIHALRLVLDPSLSYQDRQLNRDDFWDGLSDGSDDWDPMAAGEVIEISVEIVDFEDDEIAVTALSGALATENPMRARLLYRFGPDESEVTRDGKLKYKGQIWGGGEGEERKLAGDLRDYIILVFLHALRNVEADMRNWQRSPIRRLLEAAAAAADEGALKSLHDAMVTANQAVNDLAQIKELGETITKRMHDMVGENQALETELAVAPDDPMRLIRGMKIYVDGDAHRSLSSSSLGAQNVLYLALLELGLASRLIEAELAHVLMAIEEPEAHLHPHLQRLMFRQLLGTQDARRTTLVTTHSPHIASVANPRSLVVLRTVEGAVKVSEAHKAALSQGDWDDVARYLDVTRAEMVFARRVLLVEGFGEQALVPALAKSRDFDLDKLGITICAIHGTHFSAYAKFCQALDIPWAIVTDGDPGKNPDGAARAQGILSDLALAGNPEDFGIFVGTHTFEYDLCSDAANVPTIFETLTELVKAPSAQVIESWGSTVPLYGDFMNMIKNAGGKGRFAQRLALREIEPPSYVARALDYLVVQ